jgi:nucleotide-binding universal stress UspA family protein
MKNKILSAVDESEQAEKAFEYAARILGKESRIPLYQVFAFPDSGTKKRNRE